MSDQQIEKRLSKLERTQDIHSEHISTLIQGQQKIEEALRDFISRWETAQVEMTKSIEGAKQVINALSESHRSFSKVVVHGNRRDP